MITNGTKRNRTGPAATYRVQVTTDFDLSAVAERAGYFERLGVSHLYVSPYLAAAPGSTHGYDIVDHGRVHPGFGGEEGRERLCRSLARHRLGQVLDIVPNHMSTATPHNALWRDVLEKGVSSPHASFFDIIWNPPDPGLRDTVLLPVLDRPLDEAVRAGTIRVEREGETFSLAFGGGRAPLSPETSAYIAGLAGGTETGTTPAARTESGKTPAGPASDFAPAAAVDTVIERINGDPAALRELIERQHYRPVHWREGNDRVNYRRFFHITHLVGIHTECRRVFDRVHRLPLRWYDAGLVDGFRVDHPDGLRDPREYFDRLRRAAPAAWIVAEKILTPGERLPADWPVDGTTGYDFLNTVNGLFVDRRAERVLTRFYSEFTGRTEPCAAVVRRAKLDVLDSLFGAETNRLAALLSGSAGAGRWGMDMLRTAVKELAAAFSVYRTYVVPPTGAVDERDRAYIDRALGEAGRRRSGIDRDLWREVRKILLLEQRGPAESEFVARMQQLTAAAMAKGFEDTALYRYNRLISLNEVGGDPGRFGVTVDEFHAFCARAQRERPRTMITAATHDTKRGADARIRIDMISQAPESWLRTVRELSSIGASHRRDGGPGPNMEYFLYQTLVGSWPIGIGRLAPYLRKAAREAAEHTSWADPDERYEGALDAFLEGLLSDERLAAVMNRCLVSFLPAARIASLAQTLITYTAPGIPDLYQGTELWDENLVDPDNRRPVDFRLREGLLTEAERLEPGAILSRMNEGLPKLFLIKRILALRGERPDLLAPDAAYRPLYPRGGGAARVVAFMRGGDVVSVAPRITLGTGDEGEIVIPLPPGRWMNLFTGRPVAGDIDVGSLLGDFPVSLLVRD